MRHSECTRTSTGASPATSPYTSASGKRSSTVVSYAITVNSPKSVGSFVVAARCTSFSFWMRYSIRSLMVMHLSLKVRARARRSGIRAIPPSSSSTSQITPAGEQPASRARSTAASVWPARRRTPPGIARSGKMWPGLVRSSGRAAGSTRVRTVTARSNADVPVVTPRRASTLTVKAVPSGAVLSETIMEICSWSRRSPIIGMQIRPRPCLAMKLTASGVTLSAAIRRSPSFSRSSSSTTTRMRPARISSTASSISTKSRSVP